MGFYYRKCLILSFIFVYLLLSLPSSVLNFKILYFPIACHLGASIYTYFFVTMLWKRHSLIGLNFAPVFRLVRSKLKAISEDLSLSLSFFFPKGNSTMQFPWWYKLRKTSCCIIKVTAVFPVLKIISKQFSQFSSGSNHCLEVWISRL